MSPRFLEGQARQPVLMGPHLVLSAQPLGLWAPRGSGLGSQTGWAELGFQRGLGGLTGPAKGSFSSAPLAWLALGTRKGNRLLGPSSSSCLTVKPTQERAIEAPWRRWSRVDLFWRGRGGTSKKYLGSQSPLLVVHNQQAQMGQCSVDPGQYPCPLGHLIVLKKEV